MRYPFRTVAGTPAVQPVKLGVTLNSVGAPVTNASALAQSPFSLGWYDDPITASGTVSATNEGVSGLIFSFRPMRGGIVGGFAGFQAVEIVTLFTPLNVNARRAFVEFDPANGDITVQKMDSGTLRVRLLIDGVFADNTLIASFVQLGGSGFYYNLAWSVQVGSSSPPLP